MALRLRSYQQQVIEEVQNENAIIKMPTGSGKTFVAAELILRSIEKNRNMKAVFFVPTVDLVDQQAKAIEKWFGNGETVARYHGSLSLPMMNMHRVLVSTPSAFLAAQPQNNQLHWKFFCICIFDEVHHLLKDHPYRILSLKIMPFIQQNEKSMQIIGLSASLTYAVSDTSIKNALESLCINLNITKMCTPSAEDLIAGGYTPKNGSCEIIEATEKPNGILPEWSRQPHLMHSTFMKRTSQCAATHFAMLLYDTVLLMEDYATSIPDAMFSSPLDSPKLASWAEYAYKLKNRHKDYFKFFHNLECCYVGLKLLAVTWEEEEPLTMQWLLASGALTLLDEYSDDLKEELKNLHDLCSTKFTSNLNKLTVLTNQLLQKKERFGSSFRCIVFVQQRISAHIICDYINKDTNLSVNGMISGYVAARGSSITPSIKLSPSQSKKVLSDFRSGTINILVATSVAEEGIDIAEANVVICYNHMKDSVELCQRFGRARQTDCALVVLEERSDRPISLLRQVESTQEAMIQKFDPSKIDKKRRADMALAAQQHRERQASITLQPINIMNDIQNNQNGRSYVAILNEYRQKTKGSLDVKEELTQSGTYIFLVTYSTPFVSVTENGHGRNKKEAYQEAAKKLIQKLQQV